jgi:hypothetical protein
MRALRLTLLDFHEKGCWEPIRERKALPCRIASVLSFQPGYQSLAFNHEALAKGRSWLLSAPPGCRSPKLNRRFF